MSEYRGEVVLHSVRLEGAGGTGIPAQRLSSEHQASTMGEQEQEGEGLLQWQQFVKYKKQARDRHGSWGRGIDFETEQTQRNDLERMSVSAHPTEK